MKIICVALLLILILTICTGCFLRSGNQMSNGFFNNTEGVETLYHENKELINNIKNGLFTSDFVPHDGFTESGYNSSIHNSLFLHYDYENGQLFCSDDPRGEKLQSIHDIHNYAIEYFIRVNKDFNPSIQFRSIRNMGTIIEFAFRSNEKKSDFRVGIVYSDAQEGIWIQVHLEDNWYAYWYEME